MNVVCGKETIDISKIESIIIRKVTTDELIEIERQKNGDYISAKTAISSSLIKDFNSIFLSFRRNICSKLPEPILVRSDLSEYKSDYNNLENLDKWERHSSDSLKMVSSFDDNGDASVCWNFSIWKPQASSAADTIVKTHRIVPLSEIINILKELIDLPKPSNRFTSFFAGYSYNDIQKHIRPVYDEYIQQKNKIDLRNQKKETFILTNKEKPLLCITLNDGIIKKYLDGSCSFNIFDKEKEIQYCLNELQKYKQKQKNSNNDGEKAVNYALKWFMASNTSYVIPIKHNCENQYRYNCIVLCKPDFIDESQEYDHILVCSAGIILIETKHWKGSVEIRPDGKWIRKIDVGSLSEGVENPKFQMRRHEILMQKILPNVPIYSYLCFSNPSIIIDGKENFKEYPIITVDCLEDILNSLCNNGKYSQKEIDNMVVTIDSHKIYSE